MGDVERDVFDGDTAVGEVAIPREALPTGSIERFGRAITAVNEIVIPREALPTGAIDRIDAAAAASAAAAAAAAVPVPIEAPAEPPAVPTDKIARQRGLPPISEPYVRERERVRVARGWFYVALVLSIASLVATAGVVMWAREEVRRARASATPVAPAVASNPVSTSPAGAPPQPATPSTVELAAQPPVECAPPVTELSLESRPAGATVMLGGRELGKTPLVTTVKRYEETTLWFRAPGRIAERRKLMPTEPAKTVRVNLQRRL